MQWFELQCHFKFVMDATAHKEPKKKKKKDQECFGEKLVKKGVFG